jgi:hypothetical protein
MAGDRVYWPKVAIWYRSFARRQATEWGGELHALFLRKSMLLKRVGGDFA